MPTIRLTWRLTGDEVASLAKHAGTETLDDFIASSIQSALRGSRLEPAVVRMLMTINDRATEARKSALATVLDVFTQADPSTQASALDVLGLELVDGVIVPKGR
jgi:hypothetical protein